VATSTIPLDNAAVVINSTVDISDQVQSVTLTVGYDQLETTAMGATGRSYTKGLQSVDATMTLFNSYGAAEVEASLEAIVGDDAVTLEIYPKGTTPGVDNPEYTISGAFLASVPVITGTVGELSMVTVTFTGGTWARATS